MDFEEEENLKKEVGELKNKVSDLQVEIIGLNTLLSSLDLGIEERRKTEIEEQVKLLTKLFEKAIRNALKE